MKKRREVLLHVHPDFKARIKSESSLKHLSIIEYTRQLSGMKSIEEEFKDAELKRKRNGFEFKI
jgi:hypothetical protein